MIGFQLRPPAMPPVHFPGSELRPVKWALQQAFDFAYWTGVSEGAALALPIGVAVGFVAAGIVAVNLYAVLAWVHFLRSRSR